jgi:hypothetical protein
MREDLIKRLADVKERLKQVQDSRPASEVREIVDRLGAEIADLSKQLETDSREARRSELERVGDERDARQLLKIADLEQDGKKAIEAIMEAQAPKDEEVADAQRALDDAYLLGWVLGKPATQTRYFQKRAGRNKLLQKAIDLAGLGNAGVGGALTGWQPAEFSAQMIMEIRLATVLEQLHPSFEMPEDPYRFRVEGPDPVAYVVNEQAGINADLNAGGERVPEGFSSLGTDHLVFQTKKIGLRQATSTEVTEDSAVPILQYLRNKMILAHAYMHDNTTMNGDTAAALDSGVTYSANHQLRAWDGYRKIGNALSTKVQATGSSNTIALADTRKVRQEMGLLGIRPSEVTLLAGPIGYVKLLSIPEVITVDKYGPSATVLNGELGRLDGHPILVTGFVGGGAVSIPAESLNISGIYNGSTTTYTEIVYVHRPSFTYARRRGLTIKGREIIDTDQQVLVTLERMTFKSWYPNLKPVGIVHGILK